MNEHAIPAERLQVATAALSRADVVGQLVRILKSPAFSKSQRYSAFLKYCVEKMLEGQSELLKERTIGVDVFERRPDYDPGNDHVVRSAASEVRRRLAQYYQGCADSDEIRIEVLPGSYIPQFSFSHAPRQALAEAPPAVMPEGAPPARRRKSWRRAAAVAAILMPLAIVAVLYRPWRAPTGIEWFWSPLLSAPRQMTIFLGPAAPPS